MEPVHDIFISHSRSDEQPVRGLARQLREWGFDVQVDFANPALNKPLDREVAGRLRGGMGSCRVLLFAFSSVPANAKWMPWTLGLAHGAAGRVVLWPLDGGVKWTPRAREYLSLYDVIDRENAKEFLENLVGSARLSAAAEAQLEAAAAPGGATADLAPLTDQAEIFKQLVVNGPAQLYMAWLNALMSMGKR